MLEQFKIKETDAVRVAESPLRDTVRQVFSKMGVPADDCDLATDVLVSADIRGVDTHGVSNMLRAYVSGYGSGDLNPPAKLARRAGDAGYGHDRLRPRPRDYRGSEGDGDRHREGQEGRPGDGGDQQRPATWAWRRTTR